MIQVVLFDDGVGPDALHQLIFGEQTPGLLEEHAERVEHLVGQRNGLTLAQEAPFADVEPECAEFVDGTAVTSHLQNNFRNDPESPKDSAGPPPA